MLHSKSLWNVGFFYFVGFSFLIAQNQVVLKSGSLYLPLLDKQNPVECSFTEVCSKNNCIQFVKHNTNHYLKVFFSQQKDTVKSSPVEKYKTEIEIQSGTKSYYKKEWPIFQENNQIFFVLLLPSNYLKTLSAEGITKILINNNIAFSLSKKETNQIKEIAVYLLNN